MSDINWAEAIQAAGVIAALLFTGFEFRAKAKEQKYRNYLDAMASFIEIQSLLVQTPALHSLYEGSDLDIKKSYADLSPDQKTCVNYCDMLIGLYETVWIAQKRGWLEADEWGYWIAWLTDLHNSPEFRWALSWVKGEYNDEFLAEVKRAGKRDSGPIGRS